MNQDLDKRLNLPMILYVVVAIFMLIGVVSAYEMILAIFNGRLVLELGVLLLPCAYGLTQLSRGWRLASIVASLVMLFVNGVGIALLYFHSEPVSPSAYFYSAISAVLLTLVYGILVSDKVSALFSSEH
ncbi:hypothetical protein [Microbulbifer yueqingensis]|uniref:hypothetical protein n=1 Tax=Microbulbifer yueqingensis TaxID=658219 RepID=UPI0011133F31|nr:hypothetical protein [Microbulbifer yueqingensis]